MKKHVLMAIVASVLGCSLLMAEDTALQQGQPAVCSCCKMKSYKSVQVKAERIAAKLQAKAKEYSQLAETYTKCANAQQKVADAAKALVACKCEGVCESSKDATAMTEPMKECKELISKLETAQEEAMQSCKALTCYKKVEKKIKGCSKLTAPAVETQE